MIIKAQHGQSLMDIALQYYGSADALVDLANDNGLALDACVFAGDELIIRDELPDTAQELFADYIKENNIVVVSGQGCDGEVVQVLATNDGEVLSDNDNNGIQSQ